MLEFLIKKKEHISFFLEVVKIGMIKNAVLEHIEHCDYCLEVMEDKNITDDVRWGKCSDCYREKNLKMMG